MSTGTKYTSLHSHIFQNGFATKEDKENISYKFQTRFKKKEASKEEKFKFKDYFTGLRDIWQYSSRKDSVLMVVGLVFALLNGSMTPLMSIIFGDTANTFLREQAHIYEECLNVSRSDGTTVAHNLSTLIYHGAKDCIRDRDMDEQDELFMREVMTYTIRYLIIFFIAFLTAFIQIFCWEYASENIVLRLKKEYLSQLLRQDIEWFDKHLKGDLSNKLTDDLERMRDGLGARVPVFLQSISLVICGQIVAYLKSWRLSLVLLPGLPAVGACIAFVTFMGSKSAQREQLRYGVAGGIASEAMAGIRTVSAYGAEEREVQRYGKALDEGRKQTLSKHYTLAVVTGLLSSIAYCLYCLGLWYGYTLFHQDAISPGVILTVLFCILQSTLVVGTNLVAIIDVSVAITLSMSVFKVIKRVPVIDPYAENGIYLTELRGQVEFHEVSFSYPNRQEMPVLRGVNVTIEPGEVLALVGTSGCGKSTFVNLLIRFYDPTSGKVLIDGVNLKDVNLGQLRRQVGIVSQEPVLFDNTIGENIRYGLDTATEEDITCAARIANAHNFISDMPQGYDTVVGEEGCQLSGGQKQRIAIARALVKNPKVLILDEATSALDSESESLVQKALDNAMRGRTTIIIAHRLSTIRKADTICVMKDGMIAEKGKHDDLLEKKGLYFNLLMAQNKSEETTSDEIPMDSLEKSKKHAFVLSHRRISSIKHHHIRKSRHSIRTDNKKEKVNYLSLLKIRSVPCSLLLMTFVGAIFSGCCVPMFAVFYSFIVQVFMEHRAELKEMFNFWIYIILGISAVSTVSNFMSLVGTSLSTERMIQLVRLETFRNILSQQVAWFDSEEYSTLRLTNSLSRDPPQIKAVAGPRFGSLMSGCVNLLASLGVAFYSCWRLAFLACLTFPIVVFSTIKQSSCRYINFCKAAPKLKAASKLATECIHNIKTVQQLGLQDILVVQYEEVLEEGSKSTKKQAILYGLIYAISSSILYLMYAVSYQYGASLITSGKSSLVDIFRLVFAVAFTTPLIGLACNYTQDFVKGKQAVAFLYKIRNASSSLNVFTDRGLQPVITGRLEFRDVDFSYPTRRSARVLKGLSLTVEAGERVALVGRSGSGKSTIVALLERFYDLDRGQILIDGCDINKIQAWHLRRSIGLVTQEPVLFDTTIKENITYGAVGLDHEPTMEEVVEAARTANIHDFIMSLPQGYETRVGNRGTKLSGGQRQRIAIARALIRNPRILLLDEATSALDNESEKVVQEALDRASEGRTTLVIAHRLSTIQNADSIAVVHNGRIVEKGTHSQLLRVEGYYYKMIKNQQ